MKRCLYLVTMVLASGFVVCGSGSRFPMGFRLPEGDTEQWKTAFIELPCHTCHQVTGRDLTVMGTHGSPVWT